MHKGLKRSRHRLRKLLPASLLLAASWASAIPASAEAESGSPWAEASYPSAFPEAGEANVVFESIGVKLPRPPKLVEGSMMVPARALLEGFGYRIEWNPLQNELTASRPDAAALTYRAGSAAITAGDGQTHPLPVAPYIDADMLWVPLRASAEARGFEVLWNTFDGSASVRDPNAVLRFSVGTRADNGVTGAPEQLAAYMKAEWKADIRFHLFAPEQYNDRVNVMIAAGDPTDLMLLGNPHRYPDGLFQSIATDLTVLLERFPRLKALAVGDSPSIRKTGGRLYGIPRPGDPHDAPFPAIRQDWLDRLGLATPKTMDELYEVLVRFAKYDPDADGKPNTTGLTGKADGAGLGTLQWVEQAFTGYPDRFALLDGRVIDTAVGEGERKALQWLARAYSDGLIDKEFAVQDDKAVNEKLRQGKSGLAALTLEQAARMTVEGEASEVGSKPWFVPLAGLSKDGFSAPIAPWSKEGAGLYIIPRTVPTDKALKALEWLERGLAMSEADQWKSVPGLNTADRAAIGSLFGHELLPDGIESHDLLPERVRSKYKEAAVAWNRVSYAGQRSDQAQSVFASGDYSEMNRKLEQLKIKVIMGGATLEEWDRYTKDMQASEQYRAMMSELNTTQSP
ncbi:hypothetical protein FE784_02520 [Paenibacillus hemerocallicola]|uniref:Copper amine oxidase-like N-terminal domain-containing protein n=1 Tax=Paenibacillus hemerocallicola TaxID=1172614 RepID=A0A5C4THT3_9BACL|nr:stalk domain-containing protein [Paenibacillus hemerocallicola]TNJ68030.1 hypothetical protein FE784_02520 [Paenibacillus hemerocallicola]